MPRVQIPVRDILRVGVSPAVQVTADATNDHYIADNDGRVFLEVVSTDAATQAVTVITPVVEDGLQLEDLVFYVPPSGTRYSGPYAIATFNQTAAGEENKVYVDPAVSTTLKFRAYRV